MYVYVGTFILINLYRKYGKSSAYTDQFVGILKQGHHSCMNLIRLITFYLLSCVCCVNLTKINLFHGRRISNDLFFHSYYGHDLR